MVVLQHPPPIKYVLIINLMNLGRKIKTVRKLYIFKLLSRSPVLLFCVTNVLSFSVANSKGKIPINLALPGEFFRLDNIYSVSALCQLCRRSGMQAWETE